MAERMLYQMTEKQMSRTYGDGICRTTDEQYKELGKLKHVPWGLLKKQGPLHAMQGTRDYTQGLYQGFVDALRETGYSEERMSEAYNLGYYEGFHEFRSRFYGWDEGTRTRFLSQYGVKEA